jgi:hypothetical protein
VKELWEQAILLYNLPFTILLGLVVVYWLLALLGAIGLDSVDADLDGHMHDLHDGGHLGEIPATMLRVVNAGAVPLTVVLSVLVLAMWIISILLNYFFNPGHSLMIAAGFILVGFVLAVVATKIITQPLVPLMRKLRAAEDTAPVLGEVGIVRSIQLDSQYGQVEVERPDGAPALLNARLSPDSEPVPRGNPVAVISMDEATGIYLVRAIPVSPPID